LDVYADLFDDDLDAVAEQLDAATRDRVKFRYPFDQLVPVGG
jgi:hypothetical protein